MTYIPRYKSWAKPPLMYWLLALVQRVGGITEWAMRLPITLFGLLGIGSVYYFGRVMFSRITALTGTFILGTMVLWFALSRLIILDMAVSVFTSIALLSFYSAMITPQRRKIYLAAPWHILAAFQTPGFLHKYFVVEHFYRYLTSVHMRYRCDPTSLITRILWHP